MANNLFIPSLIVLLIWLITISFFLLRAITHYNKLTKGLTDKSLKSVLENLLKDVIMSQKDIDSLKLYCDRISKDSLFHIQKVGLLRFNPFKDTGGDQSFILSLVDGNDSGIIISALYSRSGTRWYAKKVKDGKSTEYELSEEEEKVLKETRSK